jgi:glycosyltransferase involved in cell wall biosynthesis
VPTALIAHVNLARGFRGGERQTELLVRALAAEGWRQRLVARRGEPLAARLAAVGGLDLALVPGNVVAAALALRGADIVHVHEGRALQAAFLSRLTGGAPYLVTRRVQHVPKRHGLNRLMYRRAARVVALSQAIATSLGALDSSLPVDIIPSATADLAVEPRRVAEIRSQLPGEFLVVQIAALVDSNKGQQQTLAVARELAARAPEVTFLLVGSGRDESALRTAAQGLANLRFAGEVSDVGNYLAAADLFFLPSRHEGLGSILLDAMAFGLPVVATRVGGIPEVVQEGVNGLLCELDDIAGLAAAVLTLRADPALRQRMAAASRVQASEYSPAAMMRRYAGIYRDILSGSTGVAAQT